jgi:hypothetical protein
MKGYQYDKNKNKEEHGGWGKTWYVAIAQGLLWGRMPLQAGERLSFSPGVPHHGEGACHFAPCHASGWHHVAVRGRGLVVITVKNGKLWGRLALIHICAVVVARGARGATRQGSTGEGGVLGDGFERGEGIARLVMTRRQDASKREFIRLAKQGFDGVH